MWKTSESLDFSHMLGQFFLIYYYYCLSFSGGSISNSLHANFEIRVSLEPYFKGSLYTCKDYDNIVSNRSTSILLDLFEARPYLTTILLFTLERFEKRQYLLLKIWSKRFGNEDGCNDRKIECWFHNQFQYQWLTLLISKNK